MIKDASSSHSEKSVELPKLESFDGDMNVSLLSQGSKRGRPAVPDSWTRVSNVDAVDLGNLKLFEIRSDLLMEGFMP